MFNISAQELLLILVVALVVVGPRRLPDLGRTLGKGLRELRRAQDEVRKTVEVNLDEEDRPPLPRPHAPRRGASAAAGDEEGAAVSGSDAAPAAAAAGVGSVGEISRTLGRGLAELRRAREEVQRSFRVDLDPPRGASTASPPAPADRAGEDRPGDAPGAEPATGEPDPAVE
ncbi:MAG: twin-arginine translocase TatA/TatE family subunit [Actinomycetota bacterium]